MASISGRGSRNHHTYTFNLNEDSYSIENNTSTMSFSFVLIDDVNWFWTNWGNYITYSLSANGSVVASGSIPNHTVQTQTITTGTFTVPHNDDGTKTIDYSFSVTDNAGQTYTSGNASASGSMALTTIPRASTVTATRAYIGETSQITVNKKSDTFTHSISYIFGSTAGYITSGGGTSATEVKYTNTSIGFPIPNTWYLAIPNSPEGTCTLNIKTYDGNTQIGTTQTSTFVVMAKESEAKPTLTTSVDDTNADTLALTSDSKYLVKGYSTAQLTYSASGKLGASITGVTVNGATVSSSPYTFTFNSNDITVAATDSRTFSTTKTPSFTLIDYVAPNINMSATRVSPTSPNIYATFTGSFYNGNFKSTANQLTITWKYRERGSSTWLTGGTLVENTDYTISNNTFYSGTSSSASRITLSNVFTYDKNWEVGIFASDLLVSDVISSAVIPRGYPVINWGEDYFNVNGDIKKNGINLKEVTVTKIWDDPTVTTWDRGYMGLDISDYDFLILYGSNNSTIVPADFDTYLTWGGWYNTVQKDAVSHRHIYSSYNSTTNKQDIYWDYCSWWSVNGFTGSGGANDLNHPRQVYGIKIG